MQGIWPYSPPMQPARPQPVPLTDRAMAAGLCALAVGATLAIGLVLFFGFTRGAGAQVLLRWHVGRAWAACTVSAALLGLVIGSEPLPALLAHLWGTAKPRRLELTLGLWAAIAIVAFVTELASR
jgi:hypothetical protein